MKKILLTGKKGQLGAEILRDASSYGFEIFGFDKDELDITNEMQVERKINSIKPDIIINTAAYNAVSKCEEYPALPMAVNYNAVQCLAEICKKNKIILVTYSTDYIFDGTKGSPYREDDMPNPLQVYGNSKLAGERAALGCYPSGSFIIRTCGLYGGKEGSPEKGNFVLNIIKEAQKEEFIEVSSDQIVSPTYAGDLSKATLKLLTVGAMPGLYNLVNEGYCSWYEFAREIVKLFKIKSEVRPVNRGDLGVGVRRPKFSALENTKAKALGIELPSWREGLKSYFNFLN